MTLESRSNDIVWSLSQCLLSSQDVSRLTNELSLLRDEQSRLDARQNLPQPPHMWTRPVPVGSTASDPAMNFLPSATDPLGRSPAGLLTSKPAVTIHPLPSAPMPSDLTAALMQAQFSAAAAMFGNIHHQQDTSELPLETTFGEIIAWRAWKVDNGKLLSPYQDTTWGPGEFMEGGDPFKGHGFYAHKTPQRLFAQETGNWHVVGTVKLWGNVVEHEEGYRAEFALPHEFIIFHSMFSDSFKDWLKSEYTITTI